MLNQRKHHERLESYIYIYVCVYVCVCVCVRGPGSSVGVATDYELDGPGSNTHRGKLPQ